MSDTTITVTLPCDTLIVKTELFDADVMEDLLRDKNFSAKDLRNLHTYKQARTHANQVRCVYEFGKGCELNQIGRLYAKNCGGLQAFPFDLRNPLIERYYWDIDMENCHYILLEKIGLDLGVSTANIKYYCEHRDDCLASLSANRRTAKTEYLKVAYGGEINLYNIYYKDNESAPEGDMTNIKNVKGEVENITTLAWDKHEGLQKIVKESRKKNPKASLLAYLLQTEERKCLRAMDEWFHSKGRSMDILIHDGGAVRKLPDEAAFPEELLRGAEAAIFAKTCYKMTLVNKPIKHSYVKRTIAPAPLIDDAYAAAVFIKLMGSNIQRHKGTIYFFNNRTGMWSDQHNCFREAVPSFKNELRFKVETPTGEKTLNYSGDDKNVLKMEKWVAPQVPDTEFMNDANIDTSMGKLLFSDGIFDFRTGFTPGFDPAIIFTRRIARPFPKGRDEDIIKKVRELLFVSAFDYEDGRHAGDYLRKALCMALYGDYRRKKFYFCLGDPNCGKGLLVDALKQSFGGYIAEWNANQMKYNPRSSQDEAMKLSWVLQFQGARAAFANEMRMDGKPWDGNLLKSLSSGGDGMAMRKLFQDEVTLINRATMFMMANDFGTITPADAGVKERCRFSRYLMRYTDNPMGPLERKADPNVKMAFATDAYKDALFWVMADTYSEMEEKERCVGGKILEPDCVMEETKEWICDESSDLMTNFNKRFVITKENEDFVTAKSISEFLINECKLRVSANKISRALKEQGVVDEMKTVNSITERYKIGVRARSVTPVAAPPRSFF